jgi:hypothetical protein
MVFWFMTPCSDAGDQLLEEYVASRVRVKFKLIEHFSFQKSDGNVFGNEQK